MTAKRNTTPAAKPPPIDPALWTRLAEAQAQHAADDAPTTRVALTRLRATILQGRRRSHPWRWSIAALATATACAALVWRLTSEPALATFSADGEIAPNTIVETDAPRLLHVTDGSTLDMAPGTRLQIASATPKGLTVDLLSGRLELDVPHRADTAWTVNAGPFRVRVTGTTFQTFWDPKDGILHVVMKEGRVVVSGGALRGPLDVTAGERLEVDARQGRVVRAPVQAMADDAPVPSLSTGLPPPTAPPVVAAPMPTELTATTRPRKNTPGRQPPRATAEPAPALPSPPDPQTLLRTADEARFAGRTADAAAAFEQLLALYPDDPRSGDALFGLGRLAAAAGAHARAVTWFRRYLDTHPAGPLAGFALSRMAEHQAHMADTEGARASARLYLQRFPKGPAADSMRRLQTAP